MEKYEPEGKTWKERANESSNICQAVIDPNDVSGKKNLFIDVIHKLALLRYFKQHDNILDFGCGTGRFFEWLKMQNPKMQITGVDGTKEMLEKAKITAMNLNMNIYFWLTDVTNLGRENEFDAVLSVWVLQCIKECGLFDKAVKSITRCLKKDGIVYVIEQVRLGVPACHYTDSFSKHGLSLLICLPIRRSWSKYVILAKRGLMPLRMYSYFANKEIQNAYSDFGDISKWMRRFRYMDVLFVFKKV